MENTKIAMQRLSRKCWYHVDCTACGGNLACSNSSWDANDENVDCWQICQKTCATFARVCMMWNDANIPEPFWGYALDDLRQSSDFLVESQISQIRRNIVSMVDVGVNIALSSALPGAGKTYRSILFLKELISNTATRSYIPNLCQYVHLPSFSYYYELCRALPVDDARRQQMISRALDIADARLAVFDGYSEDVLDKPGVSLMLSALKTRQNCKKSSIVVLDTGTIVTSGFLKHFCDSALQLNLSNVDRREHMKNEFKLNFLD